MSSYACSRDEPLDSESVVPIRSPRAGRIKTLPPEASKLLATSIGGHALMARYEATDLVQLVYSRSFPTRVGWSW